jgi:hypothetical protein
MVLFGVSGPMTVSAENDTLGDLNKNSVEVVAADSPDGVKLVFAVQVVKIKCDGIGVIPAISATLRHFDVVDYGLTSTPSFGVFS